MKKINNNANCSNIEDLIIKKEMNNLTENEDLLLTAHLKICKKCRMYKNIVDEFHNVMAVPAEGGLMPAPEIRRIAATKMKELRKEHPLLKNSLWQSVLGILKYRIPVYQAAMGVALFIFVFLSVEQFNRTINYSRENVSEILQREILTVDTVDVLENFFMIDKQKIGRNAKEDSFFTQFIITVM